MILHNLVPLAAGILNVSLAAFAVLRNPGSRLNRVFSYFVLAMAVWNFGVFMLRRSLDPGEAVTWEIVIHLGIIAVPVLYYHFVLIFLERTVEHRRSLIVGYVLMVLFLAANVSGTSLFMKGVVTTYWGWVPATGPLYLAFFIYLYAFFIGGLVRLADSWRGIDSSFRRNRAMLIMLGTATTLAGGLVDFVRFIAAKFFPALDQVYPVGIPANVLCAILFAVAIVRYRMFDVSVAVKKVAVYGLAGASVTAVIALAARLVERQFDLEASSAVWVVIPIGLVITLLMSPLGHSFEDAIERVIFSRRRGCYNTLLELSKEMSRILDLTALMDRLIRGLVQGVPATHAVLLVYDDAIDSFVVARQEAMADVPLDAKPMRGDSRLVEWLRQSDAVLVKEEFKLNPRIADYFDAAEAEMEEISASLIVPLKSEHKLIAILLLGEKLSGEIYDDNELGVLSLLANQAAVSLENARLYEELGASNAQLLQANRHKSQFLAAVSHELRTPLNSIIGFSKVLLNRHDGELTAQQETYLKSIHTSSQHLLQLINSVLDISSIEAGKLELQREEFDLAALVDECIDTSAPLARGKPIRLDKHVETGLAPVSGDRTKIRQVLLNLLSNAIKFTQAGRVSITVRAEADAVHVSVTDTGIGIRKSDQERLFAPFERLDNPVARHTAGTGLGLAISKMFVELHGGKLWVESREGVGSTFHFTLPVLVPAAP